MRAGAASGNRTRDLRITSAIKQHPQPSLTVYLAWSELDPRTHGPPRTAIDGGTWSPKWHRATKAGPPDAVALQIDDSGESWVGRGREVADPDAIGRVAYTVHGKPYFIDVPFPR